MSRSIISASTKRSPSFGKRLVSQAGRLARAYAENRLRQKRSDAARWRRADLLWPLFTQER